MSEKEKRQPEEQEYAPYWMYGAFILILLTTSFFPLFHLLDAYPHVHEYQSIALSTNRWMGFILCIVIVIAIYLESYSKRRYLLILCGLVVSYATLFHDGLGLMLIGVVTSPITLPIFLIFLLGLIVMRITTRKIYTSEIITLLSLATSLSMATITGSWYLTMPYHVVNSKIIEEDSYHLILDSGFLDPTLIKLYKCNDIGLFCQSIYQADKEYDFDGEIYWEVTQGQNATITIFVNDEAIHTETINTTSD